VGKYGSKVINSMKKYSQNPLKNTAEQNNISQRLKTLRFSLDNVDSETASESFIR
jgi:hypothetical protein